MRLPQPKPDVIYRAVDGGAVLLSANEEVYYGLNEVGSRIWELLPPVLQTFDELAESLAARFPDVPPQTIRADAQALLDALVANGLVGTRETDAVREDPQAASPRLA